MKYGRQHVNTMKAIKHMIVLTFCHRTNRKGSKKMLRITLVFYPSNSFTFLAALNISHQDLHIYHQQTLAIVELLYQCNKGACVYIYICLCVFAMRKNTQKRETTCIRKTVFIPNEDAGGSHITDIMRIHCVMSSHVVCCVVLVSESFSLQTQIWCEHSLRYEPS